MWTLRHCDIIKPHNVRLTCGLTNVEIVALFGFVTLGGLRFLDSLFVLLFSLITPLDFVRYILCTLA